ncbi:MAG: NAD(P)H-dependent oxidoreductase [Anaerolineae bacterium]|nr:NAD(P)H-dependent oxidoreductase [Anaerolineae bacterium]
MHIYIVYAHPSDQSFTYAALGEFTRGLADAGHTFEVGDLYRMNFAPLLDPAQYRREMDYDAGAPLPGDVQAEHAKIEKAEGLAFVYPVWWGDCPAILKGWFDRVWCYGYIYELDDSGKFVPLLGRIKKALALCAMGDAPEFSEAHGIIASMRRIMLTNRLASAGIPATDLVILGGMTRADEALRRRNLQEAYRQGRDF